MRDVKVKNLLVMVGSSGSMLKPFHTCSKEVAGKRGSAYDGHSGSSTHFEKVSDAVLRFISPVFPADPSGHAV